MHCFETFFKLKDFKQKLLWLLFMQQLDPIRILTSGHTVWIFHLSKMKPTHIFYLDWLQFWLRQVKLLCQAKSLIWIKHIWRIKMWFYNKSRTHKTTTLSNWMYYERMLLSCSRIYSLGMTFRAWLRALDDCPTSNALLSSSGKKRSFQSAQNFSWCNDLLTSSNRSLSNWQPYY